MVINATSMKWCKWDGRTAVGMHCGRASGLPQRIPRFSFLWPAEWTLLLSYASKPLFYHGQNRTELLYRHTSFRELLRPWPHLMDDRNYSRTTLSRQTLLFCKSTDVASRLYVFNWMFATDNETPASSAIFTSCDSGWVHMFMGINMCTSIACLVCKFF